MKKIIGIGNSLVDILGHINDDNVLIQLGLPKGSMQFTTEEQQKRVDDVLCKLNATISAGGSAANTMKGVGMLGMPAAFIGRIGDDEMGNCFRNALQEQKVTPYLAVSKNVPTGIASTFISPDGQRTFADNLGASALLSEDDFNEEMLKPYDALYVEGYLVTNHHLITSVLQKAKALGMTTCIDLASYNVVSGDRAFFYTLIKDYVDIVFANEEESVALTQKTPQEAAQELAAMCKIAVVKLGSKGSCVYEDGKLIVVPCGKKVEGGDTTGAGDSFAAGFLYALSQGKDITACLQTGTIVAGEMIQHIGATLSAEVWEEIKVRV